MPVITDPEGIAAAVLVEFTNFDGKRVFEIGCGEGRITLGYAHNANQVTAIDPIAEDILTAQENITENLKDKVRFIESSIEDFNLPENSNPFDITLFTWSL
jgi:predicted RNA methylase